MEVSQMQQKGIQSMNELAKLIENVIKKCDNNLNQFVNENTFTIDDDLSEEMSRFMSDAVNKAKSDDGFIYSLTNNLKRMQLENSYSIDKFISFLEKYINSITSIYKEAECLRELDVKAFCELVNFCFENQILEISLENSDNFSTEEIDSVVPIFVRIIDMLVVRNYSYEKALMETKKEIDLDEEKFKYIYSKILENYNRLFNICLMKRITNLERKIEEIR